MFDSMIRVCLILFFLFFFIISKEKQHNKHEVWASMKPNGTKWQCKSRNCCIWISWNWPNSIFCASPAKECFDHYRIKFICIWPLTTSMVDSYWETSLFYFLYIATTKYQNRKKIVELVWFVIICNNESFAIATHKNSIEEFKTYILYIWTWAIPLCVIHMFCCCCFFFYCVTSH